MYSFGKDLAGSSLSVFGTFSLRLLELHQAAYMLDEYSHLENQSA